MNPYREGDSRQELLNRLATEGVLLHELPSLQQMLKSRGQCFEFLRDALALKVPADKIIFRTAEGNIFSYYPYRHPGEHRWIYEGQDHYYIIIFDTAGLLKNTFKLSRKNATPLPYKKRG